MALTKKFFVSLAADYRRLRPAHPDQYVVWEQMVNTTAAALKLNNGAFNTGRFYEACGITAE